MSVADTNSRYIDVCSIFSMKGSRFPVRLANSWRGNGLPCRFYHSARTQVFMSANLIDMIPIDLLHLWLKALDSVREKPGTRKRGRNYFRLKLELVWDGLLRCPGVTRGDNFCDSCNSSFRRLNGDDGIGILEDYVRRPLMQQT